MIVLAAMAAALSAIGVAQALISWLLVRRFAAHPRTPPYHTPAISVLKPLHGEEPLLERALASVCCQDYPNFQIVFGVQSSDDPAVRVVRRLQARFPGRDLVLVIDPTGHGRNLKVGNLINMLPAARHDVLVVADSDLHCGSDYLARITAALEAPNVGLVTTLYAGLPAQRCLPALLGATQITHSFMPGALLARVLGRQDCLGATMALRRATLAQIGGFSALVDHLADDHVLGRKVAALGRDVALADTIPLTTVPETSFAALFRHELRWARTIRALVPGPFAASALQNPIAFAFMAVLLARGALWTWPIVAAAWLVRAAASRGTDLVLSRMPGGVALATPVWLLPLRELMSLLVMGASYAGREVEWRGHRLQADSPSAAPAASEKDREPG